MSSIPKKIHLCWFSGEDYPVEIKWCLESWGRLLPDYEIRLWNSRDARSIRCQYIDQALDTGKWAFAADAVRFYAVATEGGWYMDSDLLLLNPIPDSLPQAECILFNEAIHDTVAPQAACFAGSAGNRFCREMFDHYEKASFVRKDGTHDFTQATRLMKELASKMGYTESIEAQQLDSSTAVMPAWMITPAERGVERHPKAFARHIVYGSWVPRRFFPNLRRRARHSLAWLLYTIAHISNPAELPPHK